MVTLLFSLLVYKLDKLSSHWAQLAPDHTDSSNAVIFQKKYNRISPILKLNQHPIRGGSEQLTMETALLSKGFPGTFSG